MRNTLRNMAYELVSIALTVAVAIYYVQLRYELVPEYSGSTGDKLANGTAFLPFRYRCLIPSFVWLLHAYFGLSLTTGYKIAEFVSFVLLIVIYRRFLSLFMNVRKYPLIELSLLYPLVFNYVIAPWIPREPFDLPGVVFMTAGILLLVEKRWFLFYPLFVLATFNRETSIFLTVYLTLLHRKNLNIGVVRHIAAQCALWMAIKFLLYVLFMDNPSYSATGLFQNMAIFNSKALVYFRHWPRFLSLYGFGFLFIFANIKLLTRVYSHALMFLSLIVHHQHVLCRRDCRNSCVWRHIDDNLDSGSVDSGRKRWIICGPMERKTAYGLSLSHLLDRVQL